ncbi:MAG: hypothetical protein FWE47_02220 [Oscillospiraceae bacterium]|nr:hypothetical protein [Oscillospiraceae bacterium]
MLNTLKEIHSLRNEAWKEALDDFINHSSKCRIEANLIELVEVNRNIAIDKMHERVLHIAKLPVATPAVFKEIAYYTNFDREIAEAVGLNESNDGQDLALQLATWASKIDSGKDFLELAKFPFSTSTVFSAILENIKMDKHLRAQDVYGTIEKHPNASEKIKLKALKMMADYKKYANIDSRPSKMREKIEKHDHKRTWIWLKGANR